MAVTENVEEFDMSPEEALADAIEQFRSQGVDLSNIVTEGGESKSEHPVLQPLNKLRTALDAESEEFGEVLEALEQLRTSCADNKDHKTVAGSNGALDLVAQVAAAGSGEASVTKASYTAMRTLISKHAENRKLVPKPFVEAVAAAILATPDDNELFATTLGLAATLCFRTESHKRIMYDAGVATAAVGVLGTHVDHTAVLRASMGLLRNVVTNDDRSEPMSKAFDFARELHEAGLSTAVLAVARANASNGGVTADAFSVLRSVCVNNTICTEVVEEGKVLDLVTDAMTTMQADTKVTGAGASLLRTLAGNDDNKKLIGAADSPSLKVLLQAMQKHMDDAKVAEHCCGAVAALSLRCPENAETLVDNGAHTLLARALRTHAAKSAPVSRQACLAVRNIASRSIALRPKLVSEGLEKLLNIVMVTHDSSRDQAKAALRDLGLEYGGMGVSMYEEKK